MNHRSNRPRIPFRQRLIQFMSGRNGVDTLYNFLVVAALVLTVVNTFINSAILTLLSLGALIYATFRMMSRNLYKRRRENEAFCRVWRKVRQFFRLQREKWRDRKTHIYRKCTHCKNTLRLPKIRGKHTVVCPCCKTRFDVKV